MEEVNSSVKFKELLEALAGNLVSKMEDGKINIKGNILSSKDFDRLYLSDIKELFAKYEATISPEFAPSKEVYTNLTAFSNPALKSTGVPEITKSFNKKMSNAILDNYGKKFTGKQVLEQAEQGFVEPEKAITMLKYKSLYAQDKNAPDYVEPVSYTDLLDFYSPAKHPRRMLGLLQEDKINLEFQDFHKEMLKNVSSKKRKEYIEDLTNEAKGEAKTSQEFSTIMLNYANHEIVPDESLEQSISGDFLKKQYLDKKISIARVLEIYSTAPKYFAAVESILTPSEITKAHEKDEVPDNVLQYLPEGSIVTYLQKHNTNFKTMMYVFLHCNGFSISELSNLLLATNNKENLDSYIDEGSSPAKIKELYENYLIDYGCIKYLEANGILTQKDMQIFHFVPNKSNFYQELEKTQTVNIIGNGNAVPFSSTGFFIESERAKTPPSLEVYKILGQKNEHTFDELPTISHKDEKGNNSFLNNYKIVPLNFSGLVAFVPTEHTKPIYIMPYQEAAYIIKRHRLPDNFSEHEQIKEVRQTDKTNEEILRVASQFEEAKPYLEKANYHEDYDFISNYNIMLEQYQKIKIKGEN